MTQGTPIIAAVVLFLVSAAGMHAAKEQFERIHVHVNFAGAVTLADGLSFEVRADVQSGFGSSHPGGMNMTLSDGSVRFLSTGIATHLEGDQCLVFLLGGLPSGALDPTNPAIAIVSRAPARRGIVSVTLQANRLFPQAVNFSVPGEIRITKVSQPPPRVPPLWFFSQHPPQRVTFEGTDLEAGFFSKIAVRCDHRARGLVALGLPDGESPILFEPLIGTSVPATEVRPGYIIILLALNNSPWRMENLAIATVHPDAQIPGCDIWDFSSNGVGRGSAPFHVVFEAEGETQFVCDCAELRAARASPR